MVPERHGGLSARLSSQIGCQKRRSLPDPWAGSLSQEHRYGGQGASKLRTERPLQDRRRQQLFEGADDSDARWLVGSADTVDPHTADNLTFECVQPWPSMAYLVSLRIRILY